MRWIILILSLVFSVYSLPLFTSKTTENIEIDQIDEESLILTSTDSNLPPITTSSLETTDSNTTHINDDGCPDDDYPITAERFAQLVSTHWQFDHLDSIKSGTYKMISDEFQKHISVSIQPKGSTDEPPANSMRLQKSFSSIRESSWDLMDLEILHAQIFGAVHAHTEGSLQIAWDKLADQLGQPACELYIRQLALGLCADAKDPSQLSATCLKTHASHLSSELDRYLKDNLTLVFKMLDEEVLPQLLSTVSTDLLGLLNYFNQMFSPTGDEKLQLHVTPWTQLSNSLRSKFVPLLDTSILNDDHLIDFFSNYACLSRA